MVFLRKYGTLLVAGTTSVRIPIIKRSAVDFAVGADWTPVATDVRIAVDGAASANVTNLPTAVVAGNGAFWEFVLTAAELTGKQMIVTVVDAATKAVEDQSFLIETYGNASAMYVTDFSAQLATPTNITAGTGIVLSGVTHTGAVIPAVTVLTGHTPQTGDSFARLGAPTGASVSADMAAMKAETASIQADTNDLQTRVPTALVSGKMDANASAIDGNAAAAANLKQSTLGIVTGIVGAASTTTSIVTSSMSPAAAVADQFKGRIVTFAEDTTTVNLRGQATDITANTAVGVLGCTALTTSPVSGDTFSVT